jgi:3-oxoacyl-[acyl-carrier-protein] synthase II
MKSLSRKMEARRRTRAIVYLISGSAISHYNGENLRAGHKGRLIMRERRAIPVVVVTGVGASTPVGGDASSMWAAMLAGQSGVSMIDPEFGMGLPIKVAAPALKDPTTALSRVEARTLDRSQQLGLVAAREAWADAGAPTVPTTRLAVAVGSGIGGIQTIFSQYDAFRSGGFRAVSPHSVPMLMPNGPAATIGLTFGAQAGVHAPVAACASGAEAIALGLSLIRDDRADVVICGGAEAAIHPLTMAAFGAMRAMSPGGEPADAVSRPFDTDRDGFVLGEGAGILILESREHADARGARSYAQFAGAGISADSYHVTKPSQDGSAAARAMRSAISDAAATPSDVVHVNAHATSTPLGDLAESAAIVTTLGERAAAVPISATKSGTGHLLGASGAVEAIAAILALRDGIAPPTRNLDHQDERIPLDIVVEQGRRIDRGLVLSNSFGFGGHNVCLAFAPLA